MVAVDLFAGPGGWDVGAAEHGLRPIGVETDADACKTREAAGHLTVKADVAALDPLRLVGAELGLLIGSPPCPTFSNAGNREGRALTEVIYRCAIALGEGRDTRQDAREAAYRLLVGPAREAERNRANGRKELPREHVAERKAHAAAAMSLLVVEPLRFALTLEPSRIALEQVPPVVVLWRLFAEILTYRGWRCWAGVLNAADYGVPQTRERAFLLASRDGHVHPPAPTHCDGGALTLEGELAPWVSMADALGWDFAAVAGFPRRNDVDDGGTHRARDLRDTAAPAFALTEKARSWTVNTGRDWKPGGDRDTAQQVPASAPAPTVGGTSLVGWHLSPGATESQPHRRLYDAAEPAPTVAFGHDSAAWALVSPDAAKVRLGIEHAAVLQTFAADYPFQGNRSSQFRQVGNAVPPLMARHVLGAVLA